MSTRATYSFLKKADDHKPSVTFYVHYDGYPEGAAQYLAAACMFENERGSLAENFLRANDRAEFTGSHETHGDTEYRYTVKRDSVTVESGYGDEWSVIYSGDLAEFIKANGGPELMQYQGRYMTREKANQKLMAVLEQASHAMQKGWTGNASSYVNDAWRMRKVVLAHFGMDSFLEGVARSIEAMDRISCIKYGWAEACSPEAAYQKWFEAFRAEVQAA